MKYKIIHTADYPGIAAIEERRDALLAEGQELTRGDFDEDRFAAIEAELEELRDLHQRRASLDRLATSANVRFDESTTDSFNVNTRTPASPWDGEARTADEVRGRALDALERLDLPGIAADRAARVIEASDEFARQQLAASAPAYASAWTKMLIDPALGHNRFTDAEREAWQRSVVVGTSASGGYMVPTHLDPTIVITNDGVTNPMRQISRVVTLTTGNTWNGVSSAGVTASWDPEETEVSDDSPTLAQPSIPAHKAAVFVPYSIEAGQDIGGLQDEMRRLFADAKDRLEATAFITGNGTNKPTGLLTTLDANTNVEVLNTTAATIGAVDVYNVFRQVPPRFRGRASWLMNLVHEQTIRQLGTTDPNFTVNMTAGGVPSLLGRPVHNDSEMPSSIASTTTVENILVVGDFSNYVIVDRLGMTVELVPHLFGATNGRPTGQRGLYGYWRVGGEVVVDTSFRLLQDRTSA